MTSDEKKKDIAVIDRHKGEWSYECLSELINDCNVCKEELQNIRTWYDYSKEYLEIIEKALYQMM